MYSDENRSVALAKLLNGFDYAVIDTCSLMEDSFADWMDVLTNAKIYLADSKVRVYVIDECIEELKKHSKNKEDFDRSVAAKRALKIIRQAKWKRLLKILRSLSRNERHFADPSIYTQISADHITKKILAITQDKKLASDIRALNKLQSQRGFQVEVLKFIPGGILVPNKGEDYHRPTLVQSSKSATSRGLRSAVKEASEKPNKTISRRPSPDEIINAIVAADMRLSAVLNNDNYPAEKKLVDIENQLKELKNLSEEKKKSISLLLPEPKLNDALIAIKVKLGQIPAPAPKPAAEIKTIPEGENKGDAEIRENWYGKGLTIKEAVANVASHHGLMFRYRTIPYQASFHGPADLTDEDLEILSSQLERLVNGPEKVTMTYKGLEISAQPTGVGFRAWMKTKQAKQAAPKPEPAKPAANEEHKPIAKKAKPLKAEKPSEEGQGNPRLVVLAPNPGETEKPKKAAPKKPAAEKLEKPSKKKPAKPAAEKLEKPTKVAAKQPAAEKLEKPGKPSEPMPTDPEFKEILAHEKILRANLNNPKVTPERVIEDLKKQIELQHGMPHSYAKHLRFTIKELQEMLKTKKQSK